MNIEGRTAAKRYVWLDMAKGAGIMLMILGHMFSLGGRLRTSIYTFHMPMFFVISGYLCSYQRERRDFLLRRVKGLMAPYWQEQLAELMLLFWLMLHENGWQMQRQAQELGHHIIGALAARSMDDGRFLTGTQLIGPIWFVPCLFVADFIFAQIMRRTEQMPAKEAARTILFSLCMTAGVFISRKISFLPYSADVALFSLAFLYLGYLIRQYAHRYKKAAPGILALLSAVWLVHLTGYGTIELAVRHYPQFPLCALVSASGSVIFLWLVKRLEGIGWIRAPLAFVGRHSLLYLSVHTLFFMYYDWRAVSAMPLAAQYIIQFIATTIWVLVLLCIRDKAGQIRGKEYL